MQPRFGKMGLPTLAAFLVPVGIAVGDDIFQRGYTIPLVDLADQTERQTIVDREPGQYLGHPTTVLLEDGKTMIAVYPKGHGRGAIVMKRSTDGGRTWGPRLPTPASWATSKEVPTIYRVVDAKGANRLILFSGLYPIRMAVSEDDGKTWSELKPIGEFGGIVAIASLVPLRTGPGHYMALFHDDGRFIGPDSSIDVCLENDPASQPLRPIFRPPVGRPRFIPCARKTSGPCSKPAPAWVSPGATT